MHRHPLRTLFTTTGARSRRASSWDRRGGNWDFLVVGGGETVTLLEHEGPGCVTHLYCALPARDALRPPLPAVYEDARRAFFAAVAEALKTPAGPALHRVAGIGELFYAGRFGDTLQRLRAGLASVAITVPLP